MESDSSTESATLRPRNPHFSIQDVFMITIADEKLFGDYERYDMEFSGHTDWIDRNLIFAAYNELEKNSAGLPDCRLLLSIGAGQVAELSKGRWRFGLGRGDSVKRSSAGTNPRRRQYPTDSNSSEKEKIKVSKIPKEELCMEIQQRSNNATTVERVNVVFKPEDEISTKRSSSSFGASRLKREDDSEYKQKVEKATNAYLSDDKADEQLTRLAKMLVKARRDRATTAHWDVFYGLRYRCERCRKEKVLHQSPVSLKSPQLPTSPSTATGNISNRRSQKTTPGGKDNDPPTASSRKSSKSIRDRQDPSSALYRTRGALLEHLQEDHKVPFIDQNIFESIEAELTRSEVYI
jgi:hypothetical protein